MNRVTRVGIWSLAKIMACSMLLTALVVSIPFGLMVIAMSAAGGASGDEGAAGLAAFGIGGGLLFMVGIPIVYGIGGLGIGVIYGAILNLVLWMAGGLELEIR